MIEDKMLTKEFCEMLLDQNPEFEYSEAQIKDWLKNTLETEFERIDIDQYVDEKLDILKSALKEDRDIDLVSPTGSGKTQSIITLHQETKQKMILLVPLKVNAEQLRKKYNVTAISENVNIGYFKAEQLDFIVCVYDSLKRLLEAELIDPAEYVLVIDEWHHFVVSKNYRSPGLRYVFTQMGRFSKRIFMTGTPEGVMETEKRRMQISFAPKKSIHPEVRILACNDPSVDFIADNVADHVQFGKVAVLINDTRKLEILKQILVSRHQIDHRRIAIITRERKTTKTYKSIVEKERIPDKTEIILCTSVIADGVNIMNEDIHAVFFLSCDNPILIRQFVARFRHSPQFCCIVMVDSEGDMIHLTDMRSYERQIMTIAEYLEIGLEDSNLFHGTSENKAYETLEGALGLDVSKRFILYWHNPEGEKARFAIDPQMIKYLVLDKTHSDIMSNVRLTQSYFETFTDWNVIVEKTKNASKSMLSETQKRKLFKQVFKKLGYDIQTGDHTIHRLQRKLTTAYFELERNGSPPDWLMDFLDMLDMDWRIRSGSFIIKYSQGKQNINPEHLFETYRVECPELAKGSIQSDLTKVMKDIYCCGERNNKATAYDGLQFPRNNLLIKEPKSLKPKPRQIGSHNPGSEI